jgi:hypothetical protein
MPIDLWLERWTTIGANLIAITTVVAGFIPTVRWARRVRRELTEIRKGLEGSAGEASQGRDRFSNIQLGTRAGDDQWNVEWSPLADRWNVVSTKRATATITSKRLLRILRSDPNRIIKSPIVVGGVRYAEAGRDLRDVEIYRLDHVAGDTWRKAWFVLRHWVWRLFGGD